MRRGPKAHNVRAKFHRLIIAVPGDVVEGGDNRQGTLCVWSYPWTLRPSKPRADRKSGRRLATTLLPQAQTTECPPCGSRPARPWRGSETGAAGLADFAIDQRNRPPDATNCALHHYMLHRTFNAK
jgi:hypothetical protein